MAQKKRFIILIMIYNAPKTTKRFKLFKLEGLKGAEDENKKARIL